jgi:tetratricopeptide (TPR) repeat protein
VATALAGLVFVVSLAGCSRTGEPGPSAASGTCPAGGQTAATLRHLSQKAFMKGDYSDSEKHGRCLIQVLEQRKPGSAELADGYQAVGLNYLNQGRLVEAETVLHQALALRKKILEPDHPAIAETLNSLASVYQYQGRWAESETLFAQALNTLARKLGDSHPVVASAAGNLGAVKALQGKYDEAEPLFRQCLTIREGQWGRRHPAVADAANQLALLYKKTQRYPQAETLYRQVLASRQENLGEGHPDVAMAHHNLASVLWLQGRYPDAEAQLRQAIGVLEGPAKAERPQPANPSYLATLYTSLGATLRSEGQYGAARDSFETARRLQAQTLGPQHPQVADRLVDLAGLEIRLKHYPVAESLLKEALQIQEKAYGPHHPTLADSLAPLATVYRLTNRPQQAEQIEARLRQLVSAEVPSPVSPRTR